MTEFRLRIDTDNAAFDEYDELPRILRSIAERLEYVHARSRVHSTTVHDANGNDVGRWKLTGS